MVKLSLIIPVYNTPEELLEHCLSSIHDNLRFMGDSEVEVILLNDGSTEPFVEKILKMAQEQDRRCKYVYKKNSGVSNTRNVGIKMARGEYISFVDADDYLEPDALNYMLRTAESVDSDILMFGFCYNEDPPKREPLKMYYSGRDKIKAILTLVENNMERWYRYGTCLASPCAKLYRRSHLLRNNNFFLEDLTINEDGFFNLSLLSASDGIYVDNRLVYHYVFNKESATHKYSDNDKRNAITILSKLETFVDLHYPGDKNFYQAIRLRTLRFVRCLRNQYFTHPQNHRSFWQLKEELDAFLSAPTIKRWIKELRLSDSHDKIELKNIILLKLHLYWIFLITERKKRRKLKNNQNQTPTIK